MALFLVQHGKSLSKDLDPDQSLSKEGINEVERIASVAKEYSISVVKINYSTKTRARQTAEIFASILKPSGGIHERSGLKPLDDVTAMADKLDNQENIMLIGHLPFMERLTAYLVTGSVEKPIFKFQNGGIVCLDKNPDSFSWIIKWTLMPNIG
ncbi:MAG: phosphohistidine phosphatase SixA [Desulfobacterales bacterium]|nr:phosphohistidine phosphatase SixA [Deltaproteobacteria bacterium]NNL43019.1 phosphohistidine phosphatase SixA [Desulfobacterales bacterium]